MLKRHKKALIRAAAIIVLALLFYLLFKNFSIKEFATSFSKISPEILIVTVLLQLVTQTAVNFQWVSIGKNTGMPVKFFTMLDINCRGNITESITPGAKIGGEVVRAVLLKKDTGITGVQAASFVTLQKIISMSAFLLLNIIALISLSSAVIKLWYLRALLYIVLALILILLISVLFAPSALQRKTDKWTPKKKTGSTLKNYLNTVLVSAQMFKTRTPVWAMHIVLALAIWFLYPLKLYILTLSFYRANILIICSLTFISYLFAMIPALPGGLGSFEAAMVYLLALSGAALSDAAVISVVFRLITFWLVIALSILYSAVFKLFKKGSKV